MRRKYQVLLPLLILLLLLPLSGCRMRIIDSPLADVVMQQLADPEPTQTPEPTPTPEPENTPTPAPSATPAPSPQASAAPSRDEKQTTPESNVNTITPGQSDDIEKSKEKISVTLDPNSGECSRESVEVHPGGVYGNLPDAKRAGYSFTGWYFTRNGGTRVTENTIVTLSEAHALYAHWSQKDANILTLDPNGGRLLKSELTRDVYPGDPYGALPAPTQPGYSFDGWFDAVDGGTQILPETIIETEADHTLYAHWTYDPFAYWTFVLKNTSESLYACQKVSAYLEYDADNITPGYSPLLAGTTVLNVAENLGGGEVDDTWVREKNANVLVKCTSGDLAGAYADLQARFPDKRILAVPAAAETGTPEQQLYYKISFAKLLYPDWYYEVDLATVGAELGVSGTIYGN